MQENGETPRIGGRLSGCVQSSFVLFLLLFVLRTFEEIKRFKPGISDSEAQKIADNPEDQQLAVDTAIRNIRSLDVTGILCLTITGRSEEMWSEYADDGSGFVLAFDTTHASFERLIWPMGVGKVSYNSDGYPTFLGMLEQCPYEPLYRKRENFSHEQEWRSFRLFKDLERLVRRLSSISALNRLLDLLVRRSYG